VFLLGGLDKSVRPSALLLRHGDVVVMSGHSRLCYHAVPRIVADADADVDVDVDSKTSTPAPWWRPLAARMRVNINVRQVQFRSE